MRAKIASRTPETVPCAAGPVPCGRISTRAAIFPSVRPKFDLCGQRIVPCKPALIPCGRKSICAARIHSVRGIGSGGSADRRILLSPAQVSALCREVASGERYMERTINSTARNSGVASGRRLFRPNNLPETMCFWRIVGLASQFGRSVGAFVESAASESRISIASFRMRISTNRPKRSRSRTASK